VLDEAQLVAWGHAVGAAVRGPAFFALSGDLGAGKSVLARAIARGAGVTSVMPSPTFNLVYRYQTGRSDVMHMDLYRLDRAAQVWELGWADLGLDGEIVLVEWPERAASLLPPDRWDIHLEAESPTQRRLTAVAHGAAPRLPAPEA
jgi:tRNA threonylcarbamoyl adenosine modification protein YjeE